MPPSPRETVHIVGGGLASLVLARVLQMHGRCAIVYERDRTPSARVQGGVLDLHKQSGVWALEQAGLQDAWKPHIIPGGQDQKILPPTGQVLLNEKGPEGAEGRPEIDRPVLRKLLVDALQPNTVRWDHQVTGAVEEGSDVTLHFARQPSVRASLVVGADGAHSKIRPLVTPAAPVYGGVTLIETKTSAHISRREKLCDVVGSGSLAALGDNRAILAHSCGNGSLQTYSGLRISQDEFAKRGFDFHEPQAVREMLLKVFAGWDSALLALIRTCDDEMVARPIYAMPLKTHWVSRPRVCLIGDAAHVMSPFAGEGANLAMQDGGLLAQALLEDDAAVAIARFETDMHARVAAPARESASNMDLCISADGAHHMVAIMQGHSDATQ